MEAGGVNRPAATSSQAVSQRIDPPLSSGFARTELSREASVQPLEEISAVRFEPSDGSNRRAALDAAMQRVVERSIDVDDRTRNVVFRAVNEKTGEVMLQLPSEQALKLRAYLRETAASIENAGEPGSRSPVIV